MYERARVEFVVPRPSELHPGALQSVGERGRLLPGISRAPAAPSAEVGAPDADAAPGWWTAVRSAAGEQRVGVIVVAVASVFGVALAMLAGSS